MNNKKKRAAGLRGKNNPLGQEEISERVGPGLNDTLAKNDSADFVEQVKRNAKNPPPPQKRNTTPDPLNESGFDKREPGPQSR